MILTDKEFEILKTFGNGKSQTALYNENNSVLFSAGLLESRIIAKTSTAPYILAVTNITKKGLRYLKFKQILNNI